MSEAQPKPNPDQLYHEEALAEGRRLYDAVRPLFDVSNNSGLQVRYLAAESSRPHQSDRLVRAQFDAHRGDMITTGENTQRRIADYLGGHLQVSIRIFPGTQAVGLYPDGISLNIAGERDESGHFGGILLPDGSVAPRVVPEDQTEQAFNTTEVLSAFTLLGILITGKRLKPSTDFTLPSPVRRVRPDFGIRATRRN